MKNNIINEVKYFNYNINNNLSKDTINNYTSEFKDIGKYNKYYEYTKFKNHNTKDSSKDNFNKIQKNNIFVEKQILVNQITLETIN